MTMETVPSRFVGHIFRTVGEYGVVQQAMSP
jgi:hypothetical protein